MFAARAVDDADHRPPVAAAILVVIFVVLLKLQASSDSLFRPDPFRQGAAQGHARRRRIGQVFVKALRVVIAATGESSACAQCCPLIFTDLWSQGDRRNEADGIRGRRRED